MGTERSTVPACVGRTLGVVRVVVVIALVWLVVGIRVSAAPAARLPNVVLIYCDDMGYGDLGCYGSKNPTPNLNRMAAEGVRFTDFYVAQAVCSASRAALMTGCYNLRVGITGALGPRSPVGLSTEEFTLPKLFKQRGYVTGAFGKWHLGARPGFMPMAHGFDQFPGVPYSHDMWPRHPETPKGYPDLPLYEGEKVVRLNPEPSTLTGFVTEHAVRFIEENKGRPFFLYVPHPLPHVPLGVSAAFAGKTGRGMYADVTAELDASVGTILAAIKRHGLDDDTLVLFASDNGPWTTYGDHAGSAGGLREAKGTSFEGGVRVPLIARWPGHVKAGAVCKEPVMTIDLLPTFAKLLGVEVPKGRKIDGLDIWPLMAGEAGARSPHEALYIYWDEHLEAVRGGRWKLHFPHDYREAPKERATGGTPTKAGVGHVGLALYDLEADPGETTDVAGANPEVVKRLEALAEVMRADLGDSATKQRGSGRREPGRAAP